MTSPVIGGRKSLEFIKDEIDYYPHQLEGIRRMARMGSLLLADEMGLGKSLQALTVAAIDVEMGKATKILIVCPATLKGNWAHEIEQFTNFSYMVLNGSPKQREHQLNYEWFAHKPQILVMNYEQVGKHLEWINRHGLFGVTIFDEGHYMKGYKSQRTKACLKIQTRRVMVLTGSPMLNHVSDLWPILNRIAPSKYPNYFKFMNRYAVYGGYKDKSVIGIKNEQELHGEVDALMIRRKKSEVLTLPEKMIISVYVELSPEQRKLYDQAENELQIALPGEAEPMEIENALVKGLRLKQICGTTAAIEGYEDHSSKLDEVMVRADELFESDQKVIIFTQFRAVLDCITRRLFTMGHDPYVLHGDVPTLERPEVVKRWSDDTRPQPIVCMLQVAGVGLNMTAARNEFFVDKLYAPMMNQQAQDRAHRIGATGDTLSIYEFICLDTYEQRIEQILASKVKVFGAVFEDSTWKKAVYAALRGEKA